MQQGAQNPAAGFLFSALNSIQQSRAKQPAMAYNQGMVVLY